LEYQSNNINFQCNLVVSIYLNNVYGVQHK